MSIADKIQRLQAARTAIANAITAKGGTVQSGDGFEDFSTDIATIPSGITPSGSIDITSTQSTDVTNYATAQVVDADLVAGNIKKDVNVLGVVGTYEGAVPYDFSIVNHCDDNGNWVRPSGWPDLDSIESVWKDDTFDGLYMTVDTQNEFYCGYIGLNFTSNKATLNIKEGHISNGSFVVDCTATINKDTVYYQIQSTSRYVVLEITPITDGMITNLTFKNVPTSTSGLSLNVPASYMPVIERVGRLPNVNSMGLAFTDSISKATMFLERDCLVDVTITTNGTYACCSALYKKAYALQSVDFSTWTFDVPSSQYGGFEDTFRECRSLQKVDLSSIAFTNILKMDDMFFSCNSIKEIIFPDDDSIAPATVQGMLSGCKSLTTFDFSIINTENVSSMQGVFKDCYSLQEINFDGCDFSNVTSFYDMCNNCYSLRRLDMSETINDGHVTNVDFGNHVLGCYSLEYYDMSQYGSDTDHSYTKNVTSPKIVDLYTASIVGNFVYTQCLALSRASLLRILNSLPTVTTTYTLTLSNLKLKLSAAEIAIATNKGWTVA